MRTITLRSVLLSASLLSGLVALAGIDPVTAACGTSSSGTTSSGTAASGTAASAVTEPARCKSPALPGIPTSCSGIRKEELLGNVMSTDRKPLDKVSVTAYLPSQKTRQVLTAENGTYSFDELKPGTYVLVFEKAGFRRVTREKVQVKQDEGAQLNVEMEETRPFTLGPSPYHFSDR